MFGTPLLQIWLIGCRAAREKRARLVPPRLLHLSLVLQMASLFYGPLRGSAAFLQQDIVDSCGILCNMCFNGVSQLKFLSFLDAAHNGYAKCYVGFSDFVGDRVW